MDRIVDIWSYFMFNPKKKIASAIRDKAIAQTKSRLILAGKSAGDLSSEDLETIVAEEETKIISSYKDKTIVAVMALLGLSWL